MLKCILFLALFLSLVMSATLCAASTRPNIVFIFADDWGWGDLSCHDSAFCRTPNIDRLAKEGTDFSNFAVCNPVCSASRTAAMTGQFPARFSVHQHFADHELNRERGMPDWLTPKAVMLPRLLQQAGYRTGHFGKWHFTNDMIADAPHPREYGFDVSAVFNGPAPHTTPETMIDDAVKFIADNKDRPFYMNVWLHETHTPHFPSKESLAANAELDEQHRVYAAVAMDGDRKVGRLLDTLRDLNLEGNTLVVFSSDNGPEWTGPESMKELRRGLGTYYSVGETGGRRGRKRSLFEGGVHLPLIVRWPGHTPVGGKDDSSVIAAVDLLPTFCAAADVKLPRDYQSDGENVLAAFEGQPIVRSKPLFWEWRGAELEPDWWPRLAVRDGNWKLLIGSDVTRRELFDLAKDPSEQNDVSKSEPDRASRMHQMALDWRATLPSVAPLDCVTRQAVEESTLSHRPNILFILADDQRWDTIHALGNDDIKTPNLDQLVGRGFHFTNAYCMGSMTPAVCLPSRTMLLTGRSVWRLPKVSGLEAPANVALLPRLLHDVGYVTYHCGKANNACRYGNASFDVNVETAKSGPNDMQRHADQVVEFLDSHDRDKPFFIYLAPPVPHDPREAPALFTKMYDPAKLALSSSFMPEHPFDNGELKIRDEQLAPWPRTPEVMRQHLADYYACISDLDDQVGRILRRVRELGYAENTIVIFSSDQGLAVGGRHGLMGKQNLYEHVKPPLVIAGPGIPRGASNALVYLYDLFPSICELADVPTPTTTEGRSLIPIALGKTKESRPYLFMAYRDVQRMVRDDRWKLIEYFVHGQRHTQLFDLSNDPGEIRNLADNHANREIIDRLRRQMRQLGRGFGDPDASLYSKKALEVPGNAAGAESRPVEATGAKASK